jgi:predicted DNA-binding protein (MmcQ/YjbR family)
MDLGPRKRQGGLGRKAAGDGPGSLGRLRKLCLGLPGAVEQVSHGEPTWRVGPTGRVFAMYDDHHHGAAHVSVWLPTPPEVQQGLVAAEPERYWVPPYVGHRGWVAVILDGRTDWTMLGRLVRSAYEAVSRPRARRRQLP